MAGAQEEFDGFAEMRASLRQGDLEPVVIGLLHIQARLFHAIEILGATPDLGLGLIDADLASSPAHQPAGTTAVLRYFRAVLKSTHRAPN